MTVQPEHPLHEVQSDLKLWIKGQSCLLSNKIQPRSSTFTLKVALLSSVTVNVKLI